MRHDSDVYFVLHAEGAPATPGAKPPRHELASGFVNLETLLRERKALVGEVLQLSAPAADGATEAVLGTVRVDLDALAALDSVKQEMAGAAAAPPAAKTASAAKTAPPAAATAAPAPAAPATAQLGLQPSVGEYASAVGAVATAFLPSPLAARQKLRLSTLHRQLTTLPRRATEPPATSQPSFVLTIGEPASAPAVGPPAGALLTRRALRLCVVRRPAAGGLEFVGNVLALALDPAADTGGAAWPLPPHAREVLLRAPPAPPAALAELSSSSSST